MKSSFPLRVVDPYAATRDQRPLASARVDALLAKFPLGIQSGDAPRGGGIDRVDMHPGALAALERLRGGPASGGLDARVFAARAPRLVSTRHFDPQGMSLSDPNWPAHGVSKPEVVGRVYEAVNYLRDRLGANVPSISMLLGSGLGGVYENMLHPATLVRIPYGEIPNFPATSVAGHAGELVVGRLVANPNRRVAFLRGRSHGYEHSDGTGNPAVVFSTLVMAKLGVKMMLAASAVGGITHRNVGTITVVKDHLDQYMSGQPLAGDQWGDMVNGQFIPWGPRFTGSSDVYSRKLRATLARALRKANLKPLPETIYVLMPGPDYETPAVIRALRIAGADVVGMSMIPEAKVARHLGIPFVGFAVVSNPAASETEEPDHGDIDKAMRAASQELGEIITLLLRSSIRTLR